ncbi:MAG: HAD hydrolase-like protein [Clostridia bacterium]|nr:HAD hydrolase-like protein [Clostridia bacterium]
MKNKKYKIAIFDLDGTLMDTSTGISKAIDYTIETLNLRPMTDIEKKSCIGPPIQKSLKTIYNLTNEETIKASTIFRNLYKNEFLYYAKIYNGINELIINLNNFGIKCAIATYKREDYTIDLLKKFNILCLFDFVKGSDFDGKLTKTNIIQECINNYDYQKEDFIMIGDSVSDYKGATDLNIDFLPVTYGFGFKQIDDLKDIKKIGIANTPNDIYQLLCK